MVDPPPVGSRIALRYRRPDGSVPPMTDVVGRLLGVGPRLRVGTRDGGVTEVALADVVALRVIPEIPVRNPDIRRLEHAAAAAWPGTEQHLLDGWLLRAGHGVTRRANSAVPLESWADLGALAAITRWYGQRGLAPLLSVPDRLVELPAGVLTESETVVMVRALPAGQPDPQVRLAAQPDDQWRTLYGRAVPVEVLTAVLGGEVIFATRAGAGVGRAAVTTAPDGTRWVGLSAVCVAEGHRGRGHARALCAALLAWGTAHGATRAYLQVRVDNEAAVGLYTSLGFTAHHRSRYCDARDVDARAVRTVGGPP